MNIGRTEKVSEISDFIQKSACIIAQRIEVRSFQKNYVRDNKKYYPEAEKWLE